MWKEEETGRWGGEVNSCHSLHNCPLLLVGIIQKIILNDVNCQVLSSQRRFMHLREEEKAGWERQRPTGYKVNNDKNEEHFEEKGDKLI